MADVAAVDFHGTGTEAPSHTMPDITDHIFNRAGDDGFILVNTRRTPKSLP
jgi:hypothetical protein